VGHLVTGSETERRWRTGRKVGRTIYRQVGEEPSNDDPLIGVMDTPEWAALVVDAVNQRIAQHPLVTGSETGRPE